MQVNTKGNTEHRGGTSGYAKSVVLLSVFSLIGVSAYLMLPLRAKGYLVEVATKGDWPLEWAIRRQFAGKQPELRTIVDFVDSTPIKSGLTITSGGTRRGGRLNSVESNEAEGSDILKAIVSIDADALVVHPDRISVVLGVEDRRRTSFDVSYIYPLASSDWPLCSAFDASERPKIGACVIPLNAEWSLRYQWYPSSVEEFQEAISELEHGGTEGS